MRDKLGVIIDKIGELIVDGGWIAYVLTIGAMLFIGIWIVRGFVQ